MSSRDTNNILFLPQNVTVNDKKISALLIEDDDEVGQFIREVAAKTDGGPIVVEHKQFLSEGLTRLARNDIDVILLDLFLPDSNGLDTLHRIHEEHPDIPIIVLADPKDSNTAHTAVTGEAFNVLKKEEITPHNLIASIRSAVHKKRVHEEIRQSNERLRTLFWGIPIPTYIWKYEKSDFILTDYNNAALTITEGKITNYIGQPVSRMYQDIQEIIDDMHRCFREQATIRKEILYHFQTTGRDRYLEVTYGFISPDLVLVHTVDITERKEAIRVLRQFNDKLETTVQERTALLTHTNRQLSSEIEKLRHSPEASGESEQKYRLLVENAGEGIVVSQRDRIAFANTKAITTIGYSLEELTTRNMLDFVHPDDRERVLDFHLKGLAGENPPPMTYRVVDQSGRIIWTEVTGVLIEWERQPAGLLFYKDITDRMMAQESLRESEEKYRLVVENAGEGIVIVQGNGMIYTNPKISEITGFSNEQLINKPFLEFIHPDDRESVIKKHQQLLGGDSTNPYLVHRVIDSKGNYKWIEVTGVLITWDGSPSTLLFVKDVTAQRIIRDDLVKSEERYRQVVENAGEGIAIAQDGITKYVNPIITRLLRYSAQEITSKPFIEFLHPDDRQMAMDHHMRRTTKKEEPKIYTFRAISKTGDVVWFENNAVLIDWERRPATLNFLRDITEQKKIEEALKESEEKYRLVVENAGEGVIIAQQDTFSYVNPMMVQYTGYTREELTSRPFTEFVHPDDREIILSLHERFMAGDSEIVTVTHRFIDQAGTIKYAEDTAVPITWNGIPSVLIFVKDITERKTILDELEKSEEKYRVVVENANEIIIVSQNGIVKFSNKRIKDLFGYEPKTILGLHLSDLVGGKDKERLRKEYEQLTSGKEKKASYRYRTRDCKGNLKTIEVSGIDVVWEGQPAVLSFVTDITDRVRAENALKENEDFIRGLVVNAPLGIIYLDVNGTIIYENPASRIITTGAYDETQSSRAIGMRIYDLPTVGNHPEVKKIVDDLLAGTSIKDYVFPFFSSSGQPMTLNVFGSPRFSSDGLQVGAVIMFSDISERIRAQEEIKIRLRYERAVAFCSQELVQSTDLVESMKQIAQMLLGTTQIGSVFIFKNYMDPAMGLSGRVICSLMAEPVKITDFPIPDILPYKYLSPEFFTTLSTGHWYGGVTRKLPNGEREVLETLGSLSTIMIPIMVNGEFWGFIGFDDYVTERRWNDEDILLLWTIASMIGSAIARKEAENAVVQSEQKYRELVDSTSDIIYVADYKGKLKYVNTAVRQLGYEPDEIIGRNMNEFYAPSSLKYAQELYRLQKGGAQIRGYELDFIRKDGQIRTFEFRDDLKWEGNRIVEVHGIGRDVTERKKKEDRLRLHAGSQEAVLDSLPDIVFFTDLHQRITWINQAASRRTGFSREELAGRSCFEALQNRKEPCEGCPAVAALSSGRIEKSDSLVYLGKKRRVTAYPVPDISGDFTGIAVSIGDINSRQILALTESFSNIDDDISDEAGSELFLAPLDPNYIYPFSLFIDYQKDTFVITLRWDEYRKEFALKRLSRSESAVSRFIYLAARMKTDGTGWVDKDHIKAGTMDTNLNKLRSLLEESNVPFLDRFSARMLIRSNKEEKKKVRLAISPTNIEISAEIKYFQSKKHRYLSTISKKVKRIKREMESAVQPKEYLLNELAIQRQNETNLKKSIAVVEGLISESAELLKL